VQSVARWPLRQSSDHRTSKKNSTRHFNVAFATATVRRISSVMKPGAKQKKKKQL